MSNPTTKVPSRRLPYGRDDRFYLAYQSGNTDTFVNGEMLAIDPSTGYGCHCDDTKPNRFMGINPEPTRQIATTDPSPVILMAERPRMFSMPLASGTISRGYNQGAPVFAVDSGHVQIGAAGLTYANQVGYFFDVESSQPETFTGLTSIWISPEPIGSRSEKNAKVLTAPATGGHTYGAEALNAIIEAPTTAAETLTLPALADTVPGDTITVVNTGGAFAVTLKGNAAETINGANTYALTGAAYAKGTVVSDGTQWLVIAS